MGTDKRARQKAGRQQRIAAAEQARKRAQARNRVVRFATIAGTLIVLLGVVFIVNRRSQDSETSTTGSTTTVPTSSTVPGQTTTTLPGATTTIDPNAPAPATVPPAPVGATITGDTPCPAADGSAARTTKFEKAPPMCIDPAKTYTATVDTNQGVVVLQLDAKAMPSTTNNFVVLSRYHFYDGSALFRLDPSIDIIQGGSPTTNSASDPGPGYTIPDEGGKFTYKAGQIVMARTGAPNSSGAQFFLTTGPKVSSLDSQGTYLLFGNVTQGLDVLQKIMAMYTPFPAGSQMAGLGGGPRDPVIVNSVTITES